MNHNGTPASNSSVDSADRDLSSRLSQITANNAVVRQHIAAITRLGRQLDTPQDTPRLRKTLHDTIRSAVDLTQQTGLLVENKTGITNGVDAGGVWVRRREQVVSDFNNVLRQLQQIQRVVVEREQTSLTRARAASNAAASLNQTPIDTLDYNEIIEQAFTINDDELTFPSSTEQLHPSAAVLAHTPVETLEELRERERALLQLQIDLADLAEIFGTVQELVRGEQAEQINVIESNVEAAQQAVQASVVDVEKAVQLQNSARKKQICVGLIVIAILGALVALVLLDVLHRNG